MRNKNFLFIVFEGIEGSGKSYQSKKLFNNIKKRRFPAILTREPGGSIGAERIRDLILKDYFHKNKNQTFHKYTDTLLYLAARNEHVQNKILEAKRRKKILICDRFIDSTLAYQVFGKKVERKFIDVVHHYILNKIKPDITFLLKVKMSKAFSRLKKRKSKNRYDKFSRSFYNNAQKAFIKLAKNSKSKYYIFDNSTDDKSLEEKILKVVLSKIK